MATIPNKIEKFAELEIDAFSTISKATWQKAAGLLDYINESHPLGMLLFFHASQDVLPEQPDPKYWHYCDGSAVNNVNSPFHGMTPPDFRNKFIKHPSTGQVAFTTGGALQTTITHDHGGVTGNASDYDRLNLDSGNDTYEAVGTHFHNIGGGGGLIDLVPAYYSVQVYMRVL